MARNVEILAPAGSYESFLAAIAAGADAVYLGGNMFGARAFAQNFNKEELLLAIDYAHLHGRKLYLTVNTLLKESELKELLYPYLLPLYQHGLDAVIVQDMGVLQFVKKHFPKLELHASTQMTVTGHLGAALLKDYGVTRVVPARELSLKEISRMKKDTDMEIECFVHGALCYCYSGQCLLSSLIGGRSGNRGQCAQPCRLPYEYNDRSGYLLSLKDICTLDLIPEMIESGIDSFKIEGRMKKPEYVAGVTSIYRKYVDLYYRVGKKNYKVDENDREILMDLYNRGGFHDGYYYTHNGREMLAIDRPNHAGTKAARVLMQKGREVTIQALKSLDKGDILELSENDNYTLGQSINSGEKHTIIVPKKLQLSKGTVLKRTRCSALIEDILKNYQERKIQEKVYGFLKLFPEKPATLELSYGHWNIMVSGEVVQYASNRPLDEDRVRKQMEKTGNMAFSFEQLEISMSDDCFLPMQQLNNLRRQAAEQLEKVILDSYRRNVLPYQDGKEERDMNVSNSCHLSVSVETLEQLDYMSYSEYTGTLYIDCSLFLQSEQAGFIADKCKVRGWKVILALPHILRLDYEDKIITLMKKLKDSIDGVMVRNLESIRLLQNMQYDKYIVSDHNLYVFNKEAKSFYKNTGVDRLTAPLELNVKELDRLQIHDCDMIIYGYEPVMISAQCLEKTCNGCSGQSGYHTLKDRYHKCFTVKNCCDFCYNIIYNTDPLMLFGETDEVKMLCPASYRMMFTKENVDEMEAIFKLFKESFEKEKSVDSKLSEFTKGHFRRGVK